MKKFFLIIFLFFSFYAFGKEEMYYCEDIDLVGFYPIYPDLKNYEYVHRSEKVDVKLYRAKIKIDFDNETISTKDLWGFRDLDAKATTYQCEEFFAFNLRCSKGKNIFLINQNTLRYTLYSGMADETIDPMIVRYGTCELF